MLNKLICVPLCSGLHWMALVSCALLVSLDFWSSLHHYSSGTAGVHWVPSHEDHVHSSKKRNDMWHSSVIFAFDQDYVVAAGLQELLMGMGDAGKNLSENLGGVQTDSNPLETKQLETTPEIMPACTQWDIASLKLHLYTGGFCSLVHVTCKPGATKTASKQLSAQGLLKHPVAPPLEHSSKLT